jgi:hypothetical protein
LQGSSDFLRWRPSWPVGGGRARGLPTRRRVIATAVPAAVVFVVLFVVAWQLIKR